MKILKPVSKDIQRQQLSGLKTSKLNMVNKIKTELEENYVIFCIDHEDEELLEVGTAKPLEDGSGFTLSLSFYSEDYCDLVMLRSS